MWLWFKPKLFLNHHSILQIIKCISIWNKHSWEKFLIKIIQRPQECFFFFLSFLMIHLKRKLAYTEELFCKYLVNVQFHPLTSSLDMRLKWCLYNEKNVANVNKHFANESDFKKRFKHLHDFFFSSENISRLLYIMPFNLIRIPFGLIKVFTWILFRLTEPWIWF